MPCSTPYYVEPKAAFEKVPVPCGRCPDCKLRRVNDWAFRLMNEERHSVSSSFVTLTYAPENLPLTPNRFGTLCKSDFQKFMKRLRKNLPDGHPKISYYAVGEYGTQTMRPHYHAIFFNIASVAEIEKAWQLGTVHLGQVTTDSIAYTLKYINKDGKIPMHPRDDRLPEFSLMSKNLGADYLTSAVVKFHRSHAHDLRVQKSEYKIAMPRYYRQKIWNEDERKSQLPVIQQHVHEAQLAAYNDFLELGYDINYDEYLAASKEQKFYHHSNHLQRNEKL